MVINVDPNLIVLGPFVLSWHGLFSAVGLAAGIWIAARLLRGTVVPEDEVITTAFWGTIGGLIGARLFHVIDQWSYYSQRPLQILLLNEGGIAIYGAVIGGVLGGFIYARVRRLAVGLLADAAAVGLILGMAIGRIGDVINGEHHGAHLAEGTPWAVTYVNPNTLGEPGVPNHLAVGYEQVADLLIYGLLLGLWGRLPRAGMLFWLYLLLYSVARFFITFFRVDTIVAFGLTQAQLVAIGSMLVALWFLVYLLTRTNRVPGHGTAAIEAAPGTAAASPVAGSPAPVASEPPAPTVPAPAEPAAPAAPRASPSDPAP
ncbi:MAG TPA: prolipoprotein diacylglyceryl transferase [Chloroflexota bacterium]|nr:prolipoprotein diacylglyceryl transferase [Chloroflexota bacterium]